MIYSDKVRIQFAIFASFVAIFLLILSSSCSRASSKYIDFEECGISLSLDESYSEKGLGIQTFSSDESEYPSLHAYFQYLPALDALNEELEKAAEDEMTQEIFDSFMERAMQHYKVLATVIAVPESDYDSKSDESFDGMKKMGSHNGNVYLVKNAYETNSTEGMSAEEKNLYDSCAKLVSSSLKKARFIEIGVKSTFRSSASLPSRFPSFKSCDTDGNDVTNSIFEKADLSFVNVWGTFCGPCISEMPALVEWESTLPSSVQLVGIICDVNSEEDKDGLATANSILDKAGVKFTNILANDDLQAFLANIQFVPTSFLVDKDGKIIGKPIVGASVEKYKDAVNDFLSAK